MAKVAAQVGAYAVHPRIDDGVPAYELPNSRDYAVPAPNSDEENGFVDNPGNGWAPVLKSFPGGTPDPMRLGTMARRDRYPNPRIPSDEDPTFTEREAEYDARRKAHHVKIDADGFEENKGILRRFAPNPRSIPGPEPRPTMRMSPHTYVFTRDMVGGPMRNNGEHFSMADFRRDYQILGTKPVGTWRNTYRIQPVPFDHDMVDIPAVDTISIPDQIYVSPEVSISGYGGRTWRL